MGAPQVKISEVDLSTRIPSFPGAIGAIVVQSKKGPIGEPVLVTNDTQFLQMFTPNKSVEVGYSTDHFSALAYLEKSDKLWVTRAAKQALYGGVSIKRSDAVTVNQALATGISDPSAYTFDSNVDVAGVAEITKFTAAADVASSLAGKYFKWNEAPGDAPFYGWFQVSVPAVAEVTNITCVADSAGSLNNKYFFLNQVSGNGHYIWFNVNNAGVDPGPFGSRTGVVVHLNTNDSSSAVATAIQAVLPAAYTAPAPVGAGLAITNVVAGAITHGTAQNSGFSFGVGTSGANITLAGSDPAQTGTGMVIQIAQNAAGSAVAAAVISALAAHGASAVSGHANQFRITNASAGAVTHGTGGNSGFTALMETQGVDMVNNVDEAMLIHGVNQGIWNDDIAVKITRYATAPDVVKEPGAFLLEVFKNGNLVTPIESFICSRVLGAKDGYGRNIYVEDAVSGSNYIAVVDNAAVDSSVEPLDQSVALFMNGGDDGLAVTDAEMIIAAELFASTEKISITLMMDGGHATVAYGQSLDALVQARKDSVALLSTPFSAEASATYISDLVDYRKTQLNLNSSYSALFTPHPLIFDKFNSRRLYVAPDGYAAAAISFSAANYEIWFPPAGFKRGVLNVMDLRRRFTKGEMDVLYDAGINPIRYAPGKGIAIWGQKTLLSRPSALDRLNVRLLLIVIEPAVAAALEDFMFELNDDVTRRIAKVKVDDYMEGIKSRRGMTDFRTVCDSSNNTPNDIDNNRMNMDLYVKPTRSVEEIPLRVIITSTGISFDAAQQLV
jgi:hypothetical protein